MQDELQSEQGDTSASEPDSKGEQSETSTPPEAGGPEGAQQGDVAAAAGDPDQPTTSVPSPSSALCAAVVALQEQVDRNHDRLLRTTADFDNYRRRARRDSTMAVQQAEQQIVLVFLPVMDNLERAISHGEEGGDPDSRTATLLDGVRMVQKQFLSVLAQHGIEPFTAVGKIFDPEYHEAIQQLESDEPRNTVLVEVQKGYMRAGRLVRPAMVIVSKGPAEASEPPQGAAELAEETTEPDEVETAATEKDE